MNTLRSILGLLAWLSFVVWLGMYVVDAPEREWALAGAVWLFGVAVVVPVKAEPKFKGGNAPLCAETQE